MLAFIILNYNRYDETITCIDSIQKTTKSQYRIVVVDNESKNDSFEILQKKYRNVAGIDVIRSGYNYGYAIGNNIGILQANKYGFDYGIICNTDVIFQEGAADTMVDALECNKNCLVIAPEIFDIQLNKQYAHKFEELTYRKLTCSLSFLGLLNRNKSYKKLTGFGINEESVVVSASGCCFAFSRELLDNNGLLFDPHTFLGYEEAILSLRVTQKKGIELYLPSAKVVHNHKVAPKQLSFIGDAFCNCSEMYFVKNYLGCGIVKSVILALIRSIDYLLRGLKNPVRFRQFGEFSKEYFPTVLSHDGLTDKDRMRYEIFQKEYFQEL